MITKWHIAGFKSVKDKISLNLAPLTVFCGANSSGKSTVIQSILLTAQTLQSQMGSRPVVLNGSLVRLGSFSDIASQNGTEIIDIGFELSDSPFIQSVAEKFPLHRTSGHLGEDGTTRITFEYEIFERPRLDASRSQPAILSCKTGIESKVEEDVLVSSAISIIRRKNSVDDHGQSIGFSPDDRMKRELNQSEHLISSHSGMEDVFRRVPINAKIFGTQLFHFLPHEVVYAFDKVEAEANAIYESLLQVQANGLPIQSAIKVKAEIRDIVVAILDDLIGSVGTQVISSALAGAVRGMKENFDLRKLWLFIRSCGQAMRLEYVAKLESKKQRIKDIVKDGRESEYKVSKSQNLGSITTAVQGIFNFFNTGLRYLGPLRDEPKAIYPLAGTADQNDIGLRGENTAAVLDVHSEDTVVYISPSDIDAKHGEGVAKTGTLREATLEWIKYVGVADDVITSDKGKLGHELLVVASDGGTKHDLTHVGVGVSQVLPIVVQSLLADNGSSLIFEQPELHLHPRVQTRLADFFISMVRLGKQCIIETHSEYFINRLRFLSASDVEDETSKHIKIFFVNKKNAQSIYRPMEINQYGVIKEWPSGFFDESERVATEILGAGIAKRRAQKLAKP